MLLSINTLDGQEVVVNYGNIVAISTKNPPKTIFNANQNSSFTAVATSNGNVYYTNETIASLISRAQNANKYSLGEIDDL